MKPFDAGGNVSCDMPLISPGMQRFFMPTMAVAGKSPRKAFDASAESAADISNAAARYSPLMPPTEEAAFRQLPGPIIAIAIVVATSTRKMISGIRHSSG